LPVRIEKGFLAIGRIMFNAIELLPPVFGANDTMVEFVLKISASLDTKV